MNMPFSVSRISLGVWDQSGADLAQTDGSISTGERQRAVWIASIEISCSDSEMHKADEDTQGRFNFLTVLIANSFSL